MSDADLRGLLQAYCRSDRLARAALLDWLEEQGDPRADEVRREDIDWDALAREVVPYRESVSRYRWYIDCARVGSPVMPEVARAVAKTRRLWLQRLFPEVDLSTPARGLSS